MKKKVALFLLLFVLGISVAGCDDPAALVTSVVGKIGNVTTNIGTYTIKAYASNAPSVMVASAVADSDGYFTILSIPEGSYIFKIEHTVLFINTVYDNLIAHDEKPLGVVQVPKGKVTNLGRIFTTMFELNTYKVVNAVTTISNII